MKIEFDGTKEEIEAFFDAMSTNKIVTPATHDYLISATIKEESPSLENSVKNETKHYSSTKNTTVYVKDMEKFHIMAILKNRFRDGKLGELYDDVEFKSMILNLADYIGTDLEEKEMEKKESAWGMMGFDLGK